jgi:O-antigen ligase
VIGTLISVVQYFNIGGVNIFFLKTYRAHSASYLEQFIYGTQERRIIGTAGNPNLWGFVLACYAIFIFARITLSRRLLLLPILFGVIVSIAMTGSRSALLVFVIGGMTVLFASVRFVRTRGPLLVMVAVMTLALPAIVVFVARNLGSERFDTQNIDSMYSRFYVWGETMKEYQDDLLLGRGPTKSLRRRGPATSATKYATSDNNYVAALVETGIIGLLLLLALFATMWAHLWRLASRVPPSDLHWVLSGLGVITAWIAFNATADAFNNVYLAHNFWVLYGVTLAIAYNSIEGAETAPIPSEIDSRDRDRYTPADEHVPAQPVARF